MLVGILLFLSASLKILQIIKTIKFKTLLSNNLFLINLGIIIFALSFTAGSIAKQWQIYYLGSIISVFVIGGGVLVDIKNIHLQIEKLIPFIKEDLIKNLSFSNISNEKISEMLIVLGKKINLDTFVIIKITNQDINNVIGIKLYEMISNIIKVKLDDEIGEENFILIPISNNVVGIALSVLNGSFDKDFYFLDYIEKIRDEIINKTELKIAIGIGKSYKELENLRNSYFEALSAEEYAEMIGNNNIIHVDNMKEPYKEGIKYPLKEKEDLLHNVRIGDVDSITKSLEIFFNEISKFYKRKTGSFKS